MDWARAGTGKDSKLIKKRYFYRLEVSLFITNRKDRAIVTTKTSIRGKQHKKIVPVRGYKRKDGKVVRSHRRSTPN